MTDSSLHTRQQLRRKFRDIRSNLPAEAKHQASDAICKHLHLLFAQSFLTRTAQAKTKRIAAYLNSEVEASLDTWITQTWAQTQAQIFIPVVDQQPQQGQMSFHRYTKNTLITVGRYGLRTLAQPQTTEQIDAADLDCVLLPLHAFDKYGTRLGMGGGYYDRFFAHDVNRPYLLGISFDAQRSAQKLEKSPWDVGLDAVITESGLTQFGTRELASGK
jgi:5-formyltetrahydrofolate cyclo-ligase